IYIVKYDSNGNVLWAKSIGGSDTDYGKSIVTDTSSNIYVTGYYYSSTLFIEDTILVNNGGADIFIVKYDSIGNMFWAKSVGGNSGDGASSITSYASGNLYLTGHFSSSSITFGTTTLSRIGSYDFYLAKLSVLSDLVIDNQQLHPTTFMASDTVYFYCNVNNIGKRTIPANKLKLYLSGDIVPDKNDILLDSIDISSLPGDSSVVIDTYIITPDYLPFGEKYILLVADANENVGELNEKNNLVYFQVYIKSPDLVVLNQNVDNETIEAGKTVSVSAIVKNQGSAPADASLMKYYLSTDTIFQSTEDILLDSASVNGLSPDESINLVNIVLSIPPPTAAGNWFILLIADAGDVIAEGEETNNLASIQLEVVQAILPDLSVRNQQANPVLLNTAMSMNLSSEIHNTGTSQTDAFRLGYYLSSDTLYNPEDKLLGFHEVDLLSSGAFISVQSELNIPGNTATGTWYLLFVVDYENIVSEIYENNNHGHAQINVVDLSDLYIQHASVSATSIVVGSSVTVECEMANQGELAVDKSTFAIYLSDDNELNENDLVLDSVAIDSIASGGVYNISVSIPVPDTVTPGTWYILLAADVHNEIIEENENNNLEFLEITVTEPLFPDLSIQNLSISVTIGVSGASLEGTCQIVNHGEITVDSSTLLLYLSTDSVLNENDLLLDSVTIDTIVSGGTFDISISIPVPDTVSSGTWYVLLEVDASNDIFESDEGNNFFIGMIQIPTSLEYSSDITFFKLYPNPGTGQFTLEMKAGQGELTGLFDQEITLEIINLTGEVVYSKNLHVTSGYVFEEIDLSTCAKSVYFVKVL
ncbi:CARDB domain-containing protein, partial [Bacteroidota bacterium]